MKYLGIDYGTKRVGIAFSDIESRMAFPYGVFPNTADLIERIVDLVKKEGVGKIIVGESLNFQNEPNPIMKKILPFAAELKSMSGLPLEFMTEVLTSQEAKHIQGDNELNDASAAAIILQSYLDRTNSPRAEGNEL